MAAELTARSRLNIVYRSTVRLSQLLDTSGGARTKRWRRVLLGSVLADAASWIALRRSRGLALLPRLALDMADVTVWSLAPYPEGFYDYAVLPGVPLALEAGLNRRTGGLVVPAANVAATVIVRRALHRPVQVGAFFWQLMAVAAGAGFARYNRLLRQQVEVERRQRRSAEEAAAYLAGQNSVAMGADTVIDRLEAISPLLGPTRPGSALYVLVDQWKTSLAAATTERAIYLKTALMKWEQQHNLDPDLSRFVELQLNEGDGTKLLTGLQAEVLQCLLDGCRLRGIVKVSLPNPVEESQPPGRGFALEVGEVLLWVPDDRWPSPRPPDVAPLAFVLGALWFARTGANTAEAVPVGALAPCVAATLLAAVWSEWRLRSVGGRAHPQILSVAFVIAALHVVLATTTSRRPFNLSGGQNFPFYAALAVPAILASHYHDELDRTQRLRAGAAAVGILVLGWALARRPRQMRAFLLALTWPLATYLPGLHVAGEFRQAAELLAQELRAGAVAGTDEAFRRGKHFVLGLASMAFRDAQEQFAAVSSMLESRVRDEVQRRLEEVERRLRKL